MARLHIPNDDGVGRNDVAPAKAGVQASVGLFFDSGSYLLSNSVTPPTAAVLTLSVLSVAKRSR